MKKSVIVTFVLMFVLFILGCSEIDTETARDNISKAVESEFNGLVDADTNTYETSSNIVETKSDIITEKHTQTVKETEKVTEKQTQKQTVKETEKATQKQTEKQTVKQTVASNSGNISYVWLSATGSKYHSINNCGKMNPAKARQVTKDYAVSRGYGPCTKCY